MGGRPEGRGNGAPSNIVATGDFERLIVLRGDRERDLAMLERELAFEQSRRADDAASDVERMRLILAARLHREAAELLEQLGEVYDQQDANR